MRLVRSTRVCFVVVLALSLGCRAGYERAEELAPDSGAAGDSTDAADDSCAVDALPATDTMVLRYRFEDDPILGVPDDSGNGIDAFCDSIAMCPELGDGRFGRGFDFDAATDDRVVVESHHRDALELADGFSISVWLKAERTSGLLLAKTLPSGGAGSNSFALRIDGGARVVFETFDGAGELHAVASTSAVDHAWHHVVATYDGDFKAVYIDGALAGSAGSAFIMFDGGDTLIGGADSATSFHGLLDDLRVFDYPLSAAEATALASCPQT